MDFSFSDAQIKIQEQAQFDVQQFLENHANEVALTTVGWQYWGRKNWINCGEQDQDPLTKVIGFEALGKAGLSRSHLFSMGAHLFGCAMAIENHGSPQQKSIWLPKLTSGEAVGALALTGKDGGSDTFDVGATFEKTANGFILEGAKTFVTNAPDADVFIVSANERDNPSSLGSTLFIVPADTKNLQIEPMPDITGLKGSPMATVIFDKCELPKDAVLGEVVQGLGLILSIMRWERSCILAGFLGAAERDIVSVTEHFKNTRDVKGLLLRHQAVSHPLAKTRQKLEAARWVMYRSASDLNKGEGQIYYPALSKYTVSETLVEIAVSLNALMAGRAWRGEMGLAQGLQDVMGTLSASGTNNVQLNAIASQLGRF